MRPNFFVTKITHLVVGLAELALLFRIVMRLFAANPNASFVHWIYSTTDTLLEPFRGAFPTTAIARSAHVLDFTALFALIVYAIIGALLVYIVAMLERSVVSEHHSFKSKKER